MAVWNAYLVLILARVVLRVVVVKNATLCFTPIRVACCMNKYISSTRCAQHTARAVRTYMRCGNTVLCLQLDFLPFKENRELTLQHILRITVVDYT